MELSEAKNFRQILKMLKNSEKSYVLFFSENYDLLIYQAEIIRLPDYRIMLHPEPVFKLEKNEDKEYKILIKYWQSVVNEIGKCFLVLDSDKKRIYLINSNYEILTGEQKISTFGIINLFTKTS